MRLNIGSHNVKLEGFLNVDILDLPGVDIVSDITKTPWIFMARDQVVKDALGQGTEAWNLSVKDDSVDEIMMVEVLEHISFHDTVKVLREMYRVLKPGGKLHIQVPDCGSMMVMYAGDCINKKIGAVNTLPMISTDMPHKPVSLESALEIRKRTGAMVHPRRWLMAFCGAQKYGVPDIHKNIFTKEIMQDNLEEAGFERIDFKEDPLEWKIKVNAFK